MRKLQAHPPAPQRLSSDPPLPPPPPSPSTHSFLACAARANGPRSIHLVAFRTRLQQCAPTPPRKPRIRPAPSDASYTAGSDLPASRQVSAESQSPPSTPAHEIAHTIQKTKRPPTPASDPPWTPPHHPSNTKRPGRALRLSAAFARHREPPRRPKMSGDQMAIARVEDPDPTCPNPRARQGINTLTYETRPIIRNSPCRFPRCRCR